VHVDYSKPQPTDDKLSPNGAWSGHVTIKNFLGSNHITNGRT